MLTGLGWRHGSAYHGVMNAWQFAIRFGLNGALAGIALMVAIACQPLWAQDSAPSQLLDPDDVTLLEGLRQRRLFPLALDFCQQQLKTTESGSAVEAMLNVELIRTWTAHAAYQNRAARDSTWQQVDAIANRYQSNTKLPRGYLVRTQAALSKLVNATLTYQELAAEMIPADQLSSALAVLREARGQLDRLQAEVKREVPERRSRSLEQGELDANQLMSLSDSIEFQLAECNLVRAKLYSVSTGQDGIGTADRLDAFNQAQQQLASVVGSVSVGEPLWWKCKLAQLEAYRLVGQIQPTLAIVDQLDKLEAPDDVAVDLLEEKIRLAIAAQNVQQLRQHFAAVAPVNPRPASLDLAVLDGFLTLAKFDDANQSAWMERASELTREMEARFGGYWGRRAELQLIGRLGKPPASRPTSDAQPEMSRSAEVDLLMRTAADAQRKQRWNDALKAYDRALALATDQGNLQLIQQLQIQASVCLEQTGNHRQASERLFAAGASGGDSPVAASAHLRGCWNLARVLSAQQQPAGIKQVSEEFESALTTHLAKFPEATTAGQATLWLAGQLNRTQRATKAVDVLLDLSSLNPAAAQAVQLARATADRQLATTVDSGEQRDLLNRWSARLQTKSQSLEPTDPVRQIMVLSSLELQSLHGAPPTDVDIQQWENALESDDESLVNQARLIASTLDRSVNSNQAIEWIAQLPTLDFLDRAYRLLDRVIQQSGQQDSQPWLERQHAVVARGLELAGTDSNSLVAWQFRQSDVLLRQGEYSTAIALLEKIEQQLPRQAEVKIKLAEALTRLAWQNNDVDSAALERALNQWRVIAGRTRPHTDHWYEAKYQVALLLKASGDTQGALKLLKFLQAVPPGWENSTRKTDFEALLRSLPRK